VVSVEEVGAMGAGKDGYERKVRKRKAEKEEQKRIEKNWGRKRNVN
jgi:hypothetical protein